MSQAQEIRERLLQAAREQEAAQATSAQREEESIARWATSRVASAIEQFSRATDYENKDQAEDKVGRYDAKSSNAEKALQKAVLAADLTYKYNNGVFTITLFPDHSTSKEMLLRSISF